MPRRRTDVPDLDDLVAYRGGLVVLVRDLVELGMHRDTIAYRCRPGGPWRRLAPGLVMLRNGPPTRDDRRRGGLLHAGPDALITGLDALELHGLERAPRPSGPVHLLVPPERRRSGYGLVMIERTDRLPGPAPGRWPIAPLERAVIDTVRRMRERDVVRSVVAEVVQRGLRTPAQLATELEAGAQRGSRLPREVLREVSAGIRSVAEAKARVLLQRSKALPPALWNPEVVDEHGRFIAKPDAWFDDVAMAWEIDSHEFHLGPADHAATLARRSAMTATGIIVVATAPSRIAREPATVLAELERTHAQAALRPRPRLYALPDVPTSGAFVG
ncbi:hypothetical protein FHX44_116733 [Pseudonocardia hierapolitana]|uniref:Transcriptional regulator, AbiEi antitoxin, Type IV TA system n=1 Tax=Pseudonocardia hierapolitana TaxID=1128676 RepID=A0A561T102_9PSEU|nr:hypothetical protein [Pseudonocardia hierapolitana]TWF80790.1 hypothetical protein FHX44_116733 [Pseudonocardia hierapolitana]